MIPNFHFRKGGTHSQIDGERAIMGSRVLVFILHVLSNFSCIGFVSNDVRFKICVCAIPGDQETATHKTAKTVVSSFFFFGTITLYGLWSPSTNAHNFLRSSAPLFQSVSSVLCKPSTTSSLAFFTSSFNRLQ